VSLAAGGSRSQFCVRLTCWSSREAAEAKLFAERPHAPRDSPRARTVGQVSEAPGRLSSLVAFWGSTAEERSRRFPCDDLIPEPDHVLFRAVSAQASAAVLFRWLCQLRIAPYSIDPLDNPRFYLGRPSPKTLTPGADALERGQTFMTMFKLESFEPPQHITLRSHRFAAVFGDVAVTYMIVPSATKSRLVVKLIARGPTTRLARAAQPTLQWIDLLMMRRQLRTLTRLAERDARTVEQFSYT
jgi:hypothetical protein